jgi:hypothetical protein
VTRHLDFFTDITSRRAKGVTTGGLLQLVSRARFPFRVSHLRLCPNIGGELRLRFFLARSLRRDRSRVRPPVSERANDHAAQAIAAQQIADATAKELRNAKRGTEPLRARAIARKLLRLNADEVPGKAAPTSDSPRAAPLLGTVGLAGLRRFFECRCEGRAPGSSLPV